MPCLFDKMALKEYLHKFFIYWMRFSRKEIFFCHSIWNGAIGYDFNHFIIYICEIVTNIDYKMLV